MRPSQAIVLKAENTLQEREIASLRCALANLTEVVAQLPFGIWKNAEHDAGIHHSYAVAAKLIT